MRMRILGWVPPFTLLTATKGKWSERGENVHLSPEPVDGWHPVYVDDDNLPDPDGPLF